MGGEGPCHTSLPCGLPHLLRELGRMHLHQTFGVKNEINIPKSHPFYPSGVSGIFSPPLPSATS